MIKYIGFIKLIWQVPCCILSFLFFRLIRTVLKTLAKQKTRKNKKRNAAPVWVGLAEMLKKPLALPYIMVTAPRWNCHAALGRIGPFRVRSTIGIHIETCGKSAEQWTIVIYDSKGQTRGRAASGTTTGTSQWEEIQVENGTYSLGLRYYNCTKNPGFPMVAVDGEKTAPGRPLDQELADYNRCLEKIRNTDGAFYLFLHYYVYKLVCWRNWLPGSLVKKALLPAADPGTEFLYGTVRKNQPLSIHLDPALLDKPGIYITIYNKSSFPVLWEKIETGLYSLPGAACDGYYLIRVTGK